MVRMSNLIIIIFWIIWGSFLIIKDETDRMQYTLLLVLYIVARLEILLVEFVK